MEDIINNESVETQEVAEPVEDVLSEENLEVAEPDESEETEVIETEETHGGRTPQDSAFAEQRRRIQQLERENKNMEDALRRFFDGNNADDLSINAIAYAEQRDPEECREEFEREREYERLKADNEKLNNDLINIQVEQLMQKGLTEIQEIDPNVKSLDELGGNFAKFISAGLTPKEAFYATRTMEAKESILAPDAIGKVADTKIERDYFTLSELNALSDEDLDDPEVFAKAQRSLTRLR